MYVAAVFVAQSAEALVRVRGLDIAFLTPSLLPAVHKSGGTIDAGRIVSDHHRETDPVPNVLGRIRSQSGQAPKVRLNDR
jgi:hypothetical protein